MRVVEAIVRHCVRMIFFFIYTMFILAAACHCITLLVSCVLDNLCSFDIRPPIHSTVATVCRFNDLLTFIHLLVLIDCCYFAIRIMRAFYENCACCSSLQFCIFQTANSKLQHEHCETIFVQFNYCIRF